MQYINGRSKLGDYFVAFKLAKKKQVSEALRSARPTELLGQVLVRLNICSTEVVEKVTKVQSMVRQAAAQHGVNAVLNKETVIGDVLVALGCCTWETKERWAAYQDGQRALGIETPRLAQLLVDKGEISEEHRLLALQVQNWLRGV